MDLGVEISDQSGWTIAAISGEIDVATAPRLREQLIELVTDGHVRLIVDLDAVDFIDSTGLGVLVGALKRARTNGGELRVVCSHSRIVKVFEITGLDEVFAITPTIDDSLALAP